MENLTAVINNQNFVLLDIPITGWSGRNLANHLDEVTKKYNGLFQGFEKVGSYYKIKVLVPENYVFDFRTDLEKLSKTDVPTDPLRDAINAFGYLLKPTIIASAILLAVCILNELYINYF